MMKIHEEDQYNDCYGRKRMYLALQQRKDAGKTDIDIPCEATVRKVMAQIGLIHKPRRKPNRITKLIGLLKNRMIFSDVIFTQTGL